ncbi:hypothetical protein P280DRAFT_466341 [Massarina eburnea CBS 473.64]|uniref:Uncharacterized protein n=1 Tax=Massarina eburnea CBS 473.64 TaxID=1395130 RepID=A0A6A6SBC9_9PLEO|nr:hypothetical protein P280DRAFT_466341 [Massarina eburnea CBS 473.64]
MNAVSLHILQRGLGHTQGEYSIFAGMYVLDIPWCRTWTRRGPCGISRYLQGWSMNGLPPPPVALSVLAEKTADFSTL